MMLIKMIRIITLVAIAGLLHDVTNANAQESTLTNLILRKLSAGREKQMKNTPQRNKRDANDEKPKARSLTVNGTVEERFAMTDVISIMENPSLTTDREAEFTVQIPEAAFISNFSMMIEGELFIAEIKGKEEAAAAYSDAKEQDQTAGTVTSRPRDLATAAREMEIFSVAVNVAPNSSVEFKLSYQQTLTRQLGVYKYIASIRPQQIVDNIFINIDVHEENGIREFSEADPQRNWFTRHDTGENKAAPVHIPVQKVISSAEQRAMDPVNGITGDLILRYDINHQDGIGDIKIVGDTLIHSFTPKNLLALPKNIAFVIDVSGSMSGHKINQTLNAMLTILDQLRPDDMFNMILFESQRHYWPITSSVYRGGETVGRKAVPEEPVTRMVKASRYNIDQAKAFAQENIVASGGTNVNDALVEACRILKTQQRPHGNFIVFLTDGSPTSGVTSPKHIVRNVEVAARKTGASGSVQIFSLGFGFSLNYDLLEMISKTTEGRVKRIYAESDAAIQLTSFYDEISTPLIYDLDFTYDENVIDVKTITKNKFPQFFSGTEIMIAGKVKENSVRLVYDNRNKRSYTGRSLFCIVGGWTDRRINYNGTFIVDPIRQVPDDYDINYDIDCVNMETPTYTPAGNKTWIPANYAERLWANLFIKDLLRSSDIERLVTVKNKAKRTAMCLALKYHLVTPVTSLLIVQETPKLSRDAGERGSLGLTGPQGQVGRRGPPGPLANSGQAGPRGYQGYPAGPSGQYSPPARMQGNPSRGPAGPAGMLGGAGGGYAGIYGQYPFYGRPQVPAMRATITRATTTTTKSYPTAPTTIPTSTISSTTSSMSTSSTATSTSTSTTTTSSLSTSPTTTSTSTSTTITSTPSTSSTTTLGTLSADTQSQNSLPTIQEGRCRQGLHKGKTSYLQIMADIQNNTAHTEFSSTISTAATAGQSYEYTIEIPAMASIYQITVHLRDGSTKYFEFGDNDKDNSPMFVQMNQLRECPPDTANFKPEMKQHALLINAPQQGNFKLKIDVKYREELKEQNGTCHYVLSAWNPWQEVKDFFFYLSLEDATDDIVTSAPLKLQAYVVKMSQSSFLTISDMSQHYRGFKENIVVSYRAD